MNQLTSSCLSLYEAAHLIIFTRPPAVDAGGQVIVVLQAVVKQLSLRGAATAVSVAVLASGVSSWSTQLWSEQQ